MLAQLQRKGLNSYRSDRRLVRFLLEIKGKNVVLAQIDVSRRWRKILECSCGKTTRRRGNDIRFVFSVACLNCRVISAYPYAILDDVGCRGAVFVYVWNLKILSSRYRLCKVKYAVVVYWRRSRECNSIFCEFLSKWCTFDVPRGAPVAGKIEPQRYSFDASITSDWVWSLKSASVRRITALCFA